MEGQDSMHIFLATCNISHTPHRNVLIRLRRNWMLVSLKCSHTKKGENLHANVEISYDNFVTATSRQFFIEGIKDIMSSSQFLDDHGYPQTEAREHQRKISAAAIIFSRKQIKLNM